MIKAIIPIKQHSSRIPRKNFVDLGGHPLLYHLIKTLHYCNFDQIIVDANGDEVVDVVQDLFPTVTISKRPKHLCDDLVGGNELLSRFVVGDDVLMQLHVTSPFLKADTINKAIKMTVEHGSVFSVTRIMQRVWLGDMTAVNHDPGGPTLRTQDLPPVYHENGAFFGFKSSFFRQHNARNNAESKMIELDFPETIDIDEQGDLELARLYNEKSGEETVPSAFEIV